MSLTTAKGTGGEDHDNRPRWFANKKMDAVMWLPRGEPIDEVSRGLGIEGIQIPPPKRSG
jgi:hypothetical protein